MRRTDTECKTSTARRLMYPVALSAVLLLAFASVGHRLFVRDGLINSYALDHELFMRLRCDYDRDIPYDICCMPQEDLIDTDRRFRVRTDAVGRRFVDGNRADGVRVLLLGDSNLFGLSLSQGETIADDLVRGAERSGLGLWVSNWAFVGNNSTVGALHARVLIPRERPRLVVISFGPNDATLTPQFVPPMFERTRQDLMERDVPRWLATLGLLCRAMRNLVVMKVSDVPRVPMVAPERYRENLTAMIALAEECGSAVILLDLVQDDQPDAADRADWAPYARAIADLQREHQSLGVIDVDQLRAESNADALQDPRFRERRARIRATYNERVLADDDSRYWLTTDGGHPNAILAELLASEILCTVQTMNPDDFVFTNQPECRDHGQATRASAALGP